MAVSLSRLRNPSPLDPESDLAQPIFFPSFIVIKPLSIIATTLTRQEIIGPYIYKDEDASFALAPFRICRSLDPVPVFFSNPGGGIRADLEWL
jgi:hypothetical protein